MHSNKGDIMILNPGCFCTSLWQIRVGSKTFVLFAFSRPPFLYDRFVKNHHYLFSNFPPTFSLLRYRFTTDLVFVNTLISKKFFFFKSSIYYLAFFFLENFFGVLHKKFLHVDKHLRTKRYKHITGQWCQHFVPKG